MGVVLVPIGVANGNMKTLRDGLFSNELGINLYFWGFRASMAHLRIVPGDILLFCQRGTKQVDYVACAQEIFNSSIATSQLLGQCWKEAFNYPTVAMFTKPQRVNWSKAEVLRSFGYCPPQNLYCARRVKETRYQESPFYERALDILLE